MKTIVDSIEQPVQNGIELPGFPPDQFQSGSVGSSGEHTLREAFNFYCEIKRYAAVTGLTLCPDSRVLDFGCGWGRIIRFFLKDVSSDNLYGVDVDPDMVDICKNLVRYGNYSTVKPLPPTDLPDASVDIVYAYSVFSHLSEHVHIKWVEEFARILKPGGLLIATTQARYFIEFCKSLRGETHKSAWHNMLATLFEDTEATLAEYDKGGFIYCATGGGEARPSSFYGEALIPRGYVEREWTKYLSLVDFVDERNRLPQALIVMQKPDPLNLNTKRKGLNDNIGQIRNLESVIEAKETHIKQLENHAAELDALVKAREAQVQQLENHAGTLEYLLNEKETVLNNIYKSRAWKVVLSYYKFRDKMFRQ